MRLSGFFLTIMLVVSTVASFAGGVPEKVWDALGSDEETLYVGRYPDGESVPVMDVIEESVAGGLDLTAEYKRNGNPTTPFIYFIRYGYDIDSSDSEQEQQVKYEGFVLRFLDLYELLPEEKRDFIHEEDVVFRLNDRSGPDLGYIRILADKDAPVELDGSDLMQLKSLSRNYEVRSRVMEYWEVTEESVSDEPIELRRVAEAIGLGTVELKDVQQVLGPEHPLAISKASDRLDRWLRRGFEPDPVLDSFIEAFQEGTGLRDIPFPAEGEGYGSSFLGESIKRLRPDHLRHLLELGLRQDRESLLSAYSYPEHHPTLFRWLSPVTSLDLTPSNRRRTRRIVALIISYEFDLEDGYAPGFMTPLHQLAWFGDVEAARRLVEAGADVRVKETWGRFPVDLARRQGHTELVEYLDPLTYGGNSDRVVIQERAPEDESPPRIRLNPLDRQRGLAVAEEERYDGRTTLSSIAIGGIVVDESQIERVTVADADTTFNNLGEFDLRVPLEIGENRIAVVAEDEAGNRATETVVVLREEARTLADELGIAGTYYALIIGIEGYADMPELLTPHEDASRLEQILSSTYGFETELLIDASRADILDAINRYVRLLEPEDRFILYYAGHGYFDETADLAYWLPVDASTDTDTNWILSNRITGSLRRMEAQHVAVIADSCYSGTLTRDASIDLTSGDRTTTEYLRRMVERPSRTLLASGGNEPVADGGGGNHSAFAGYLLNALESTDQEVFSLEDLFHNEIRVQVTGNSLQTPEYNTIRNSGHEGGDFVFVRQ